MLKDTAGLCGEKPVICPKSDEEEQDAGAAKEPGCEGGYSNLHRAAGRQQNWKSEKKKNPEVSKIAGREGREKCYFWMGIIISSWLV